MVKKNERIIRIITLGPSGVGKTSIIQRIINNDFKEYAATIGFEFYYKEIDYKSLKLKLHYIDTGGQERYNDLPMNYIRNSTLVLLVFDNIRSLKELENRWYKFYKNNEDIKRTKFIVIANKSDSF